MIKLNGLLFVLSRCVLKRQYFFHWIFNRRAVRNITCIGLEFMSVLHRRHSYPIDLYQLHRANLEYEKASYLFRMFQEQISRSVQTVALFISRQLNFSYIQAIIVRNFFRRLRRKFRLPELQDCSQKLFAEAFDSLYFFSVSKFPRKIGIRNVEK